MLRDGCPRLVCIQRSKLMNRLCQGTPALQEGDLVLKVSVQFSRSMILFSNRLTSCLVWEIYKAKITDLFPFPTETEITGLVPGENSEQAALWEALLLEMLTLFY